MTDTFSLVIQVDYPQVGVGTEGRCKGSNANVENAILWHGHFLKCAHSLEELCKHCCTVIFKPVATGDKHLRGIGEHQ